MSIKKSKMIDELELYIQSLQLSEEEKEILNEKIEGISMETKKLSVERDELVEKVEKATQKYRFYESSIDALPNPIFIKNDEGEFEYFNSAYQKYFGMERELYLNKTVLDLNFLPMEDRSRYHKEDLELIRTGNVMHYESVFQLPEGGTSQSLYWSTGFEVGGSEVKGLVGEIVDITLQKNLQAAIAHSAKQLRRANEQIEMMMSRDCLTGLYNRRVIEENIYKIDHSVHEKGEPVSLVMVDLDNFKITNDTFGHAVGDEVLMEFATILMTCNRKEDIVVRFGGEEFLLILFNATMQQAGQVAERIRIMTEKNLLLPNGKTNTASFGVSQIFSAGTFYAALKRADAALYSAKERGKNKVVVYPI